MIMVEKDGSVKLEAREFNKQVHENAEYRGTNGRRRLNNK